MKAGLKKEKHEKIQEIVESYDFDIIDYKEATTKFMPKMGKRITFPKQYKKMIKVGEKLFAAWLGPFLKQAKQLAKALNQKELKGFDNDKILQKIAEIPLKIEETIQEIKDKLDKLLGKYLDDIMYPHSPDFNLQKLLDKIDKLLNPVISTTAPLKSVAGKIPVVGDLSGILAALSSGGGGQQMSKNDIKKLIPKPPELDSQLLAKVNGIYEDIMATVQTLPMVLIDVIFQMLKMIYDKLKIIVQVIPLGNMFPLSLVSACIEAVPKIKELIQQLPALVKHAVEGKVRQKLAEAAAMKLPKVPSPTIDKELFDAMVEDMVELQKTKNGTKPNIMDYKDVMKKVYGEKLFSEGYTESQAETVMKSYKDIFNGSDKLTVTSKQFINNYKTQVLEPDPDKPEEKAEKGYDEKDLERTKPSPEDFEKYFNDLISKSDLSASLTYEKLMKTESVAGEWYLTYMDQLKKYGQEVVMGAEMEPSSMLKRMRKGKSPPK